MAQTGIPYSLLLSLPDGNQMFPIRRDGFSLKMCVGAEGKHQTASCKLTVEGADIVPILMTSSTDLIEAKVRDSQGAILFTGIIRPYASVDIEQTRVGDVQLEVLDYTEKLHKKVNEDVTEYLEEIPEGAIFSKSWDEIQVCNPGYKTKSIVHVLCSFCGISDIEAPEIPSVLHRFEIKAGDYIDDVLATILYEYVYDYRFDENGKLIVFQTADIVKGDDEEDITRLRTEDTIDVFNTSISLSRSDDKKTGVVIKYNKYIDLGDVRIWKKNIAPGDWSDIYHDTWGRDTFFNKDVTWDLSEIEEDATAIVLSGFYGKGSTGSNTSGSVKVEVSNATQKGGHVKITFDGRWWFGGGSLNGAVYAKATYLKPEQGTMGTAGEDAEQYTTSYLEAMEDSLTLYYAIASRQKQCVYQYSFQSREKLKPGALYAFIEDKISGIQTRVRLLSREQKDDTGLYSYKAEGYDEFTIIPPDFSHEVPDEGESAEPDFFMIDASVKSFAWEDEAEAESIVTVAGNIFDKYNATPRWFIRNTEIEGETDTILRVKKSQLAVGLNRITCKAELNGVVYEAYVDIKVEDADVAISMQFAAVPKGESPDSSTVWLDTQPEPADNEVIWMRFKTTSSGEWIVVKMTAEDGGNPVVYFQWAATATIRPDDAYELLTWEDTAITWEIDGEIMGFILDSGRWETLVPDKPFGLNYLWVKYWNYQEEQWDYFCTTGSPAMDFNLIVNPQTFKLTSRGVTQDNQKINVRCQRMNTTAPITWSVEPEDEDLLHWERDNDADDSEITIYLESKVALSTITIHCSIADIDVAKDFVVSGVQEGIQETMYLGIYTSGATLPDKTTEGDLIPGDHLIIQNSNGVRDPYYWNGDAWVIADGNMPTEFGFKVLQDILWDAVNAPASATTMSAYNLFVANMAANLLFSYYAKIRNLQIGSGGSGLDVDIYDYNNGTKVTPVFRVRYGGKTVFQIDPATGNVFFGEPNSGLKTAKTGFMYQASDQTIRSTGNNVIIKADGTIEAKNGIFAGEVNATSGTFTGTVNATDGIFKGTIITAAIESGPSDYNHVTYYHDGSPWDCFAEAKYIYELVAASDFASRINDGYIKVHCAMGGIYNAMYAKVYHQNGLYGVNFYSGNFKKIPDSYFSSSLVSEGSRNYTILYEEDEDKRLDHFAYINWGEMTEIQFSTGAELELNLPGSPSDSLPDWIRHKDIYIDENGFIRMRFIDENGYLD